MDGKGPHPSFVVTSNKGLIVVADAAMELGTETRGVESLHSGLDFPLLHSRHIWHDFLQQQGVQNFNRYAPK